MSTTVTSDKAQPAKATRASSRPSSHPAQTSYAPGSRIRVRDEEWVVERCQETPTNGYAVHCVGLTELVRHHRAVFLTELDAIEALKPEDTKLVTDKSPSYRTSRLYLETLLRRTPPTDSFVHLGHKGAVEVYPYQLVPTRKALSDVRARILIADGVGLGKTIEVGMLLTELIKRGRGRRILVVAIKSMLAQFQQELWTRFTIPLVRLDSEGIQRVQAQIPSNRNPFSHFDRAIISVDTLKNNARYRAWLEQTRWDAVVIDECHNVANRGSQREVLARLLADTADSLILTSATPHNGRPESFANLMRMLDRTAVPHETEFTRDDVGHLFVRRFKKDIEREAGGSFSEREIHRHDVTASSAEEAALSALRELSVHTLGRKRHQVDRLFRWVLVKAFLSSPHACLQSIDERVKRVEKAVDDESETTPHPHAAALKDDARKLLEMRTLVQRCHFDPSAVKKGLGLKNASPFGKMTRLIEQLEKLGFNGSENSPRVIVFSERIETLETLDATLRGHFGLPARKAEDLSAKEVDAQARIAIFNARLSDVEQKDLVESFGKKESPLRLLLASDAASEGVNLHYYCHQLFHFDVPWSLIRLEQRMGRIDRFGQKHTPHLHYLLTRTSDSAADQQIIERLIAKEKEVHKQLGEAGAIMGIYEAEQEEEYVLREVAEGKAPEDIVPDEPRDFFEPPEADNDEAEEGNAPQPAHATASSGLNLDIDLGLGDLLAAAEATTGTTPQARAHQLRTFLEKSAEADAPEPVDEAVTETPSLFTSDYDFALQALETLELTPAHELRSGDTQALRDGAYEPLEGDRALRIWPPESFRRHREPFLPQEAVPAQGGAYQLVESRDKLLDLVLSARETSNTWPNWHLLWEQHPVFTWLLDGLAAAYARHEAPVLMAPTAKGKTGAGPRAHFLFFALLSNARAQPVLAEWFALPASLGAKGAPSFDAPMALEPFLREVGLIDSHTPPANVSLQKGTLEQWQAIVPAAVHAAREHTETQYKAALGPLRKQVRGSQRRLDKWQSTRLSDLDKRRADIEKKRHGKLPTFVEQRMNEEKARIERASRDHTHWLEGLTKKGEPFIRLAATFVHP